MNESTPGQPRCAARIFLPHSAPVQPGWHRCELEGGHELYEEEHHAEPLCGTEVMPFAEGLHSWIRWKGWTTKYEISVFDHCEAPGTIRATSITTTAGSTTSTRAAAPGPWPTPDRYGQRANIRQDSGPYLGTGGASAFQDVMGVFWT